MRTKSRSLIVKLLVVLFMACCIGTTLSATLNAKADTNGFELLRAEIRSEAPAGIRFVTNVSSDFYADHSDDVFGTLIIPTNLLGENEVLSLTTPKAQNIVTKNWKVQPGSGDVYTYTSTLIGKDMDSSLPEKEWNRDLTAVSYVWDGTNYESAIYSDAQVRSMAGVAATVLADESLEEDEAVFFKQICDTVIGSEGFAFEQGASVSKKDLAQSITLSLTGNKGLKAKFVSDSQDITVDANGVVTATAYGTATITATIGTKTASIDVSYVEPVATSLSFKQDSIELYASVNFRNKGNTVNTTSRPEISVLDQDGDPMDVSKLNITFSSNHEKTATVASDGTITSGKSINDNKVVNPTITASLNDLSDTLTVYVRDVLMDKKDLDYLAYSSRLGYQPFLDTNTYYVLINDIDYNGAELQPVGVNPHLSSQMEWGRTDYPNWNDKTYWFPFKGTIDGKGHIIKNAYIPSMVMVSSQNEFTMGSAFIGKLTGTLKNIGFVNLQTKLVADEQDNFNTNCTRTFDKITDTQISSGLVSTNEGTIENVYLDMKVYKKSYGAYCCGSLVGNASKGTIRNCVVVSEKDYSKSTAPLTPGNYIDYGAVIGINTSTTITNVFAVSSTLAKYDAKGNIASDIYKNVSSLLSAKATEIAAFGGYWSVANGTLMFGNTEIK